MSFYYDTETYNTQSAELILPIVFSLIGVPTNVLDVGCGNGSWLKVLEKYGVSYQGIDGSHVSEKNFLADYACFRAEDLSRPFHLHKKYDLVLSLEVAEHLPLEAADVFIENLVKHGDTILFSAAVPFQGGFMHLNEQYPSYWVEKFAKHHYAFYDLIRPKIWYNQKIQVWYRQNIFLVGNASSLLAQKFSPDELIYDKIHPELFEAKAKQALRAEQMERGELGIRLALQSLKQAILKKLWKK
ncbi:MAG: hypothetical protein OHK0045_02990 [Raineya sp.]